MDRKKRIAVLVSAMLTLSSVSVYGTDFSGFSDGREAQTEAAVVQEELQTDGNNSDIDTFQDEAETEVDQEFTDEGQDVLPTSEMSAETELTDGNNIDANGFEYEYLPESDTYCLVKGADIENVMIPYQYNGKIVSEIGERAFYGYGHIKTVTAESGIDRGKIRLHINKSAFERCENLRKVEFDQGAKLESRAFYNCPRLYKFGDVTDPKILNHPEYYGVTEIEEDSFDPDTKLIFEADECWITKTVQDFSDKYRVFVEISDAADTYILRDDDGEAYREYKGKRFCVDCDDSMPVVQVCRNTEVIGRKAFYGCFNVRKVLIPKETKTIETKAFAKCENMSIIIPPSVTSISEDTFEGASGITVYVDRGSYAEKYAKKHGLTYKRTPKSVEVPIPKMKVTYNSKYGDLH